MNLCLFDLDDTLLPFDSDHAWGEFMIDLGWADPSAFRAGNDAFFAQYQAGRLDIDAYIEFATRPLRSRSADEQRDAQGRFIEEKIRPALAPAVFDLVERHRAQGDWMALVTATNEFVTAPIARLLGIDELIAVRLERDAEGRITGRIDGVPSYREGKVERVGEWLKARSADWSDFQRISVYSDSTNDLPLLERATEAVATHPTPALEAIALERGWRILRLYP